MQKILNKLYTANIYSVNLILVQMLVNTTNLEYTCTGLNFGQGDLWYPPRLLQAGHTGRNFIFLWGGQVHLFSYSRIESESTTTLVTKARNTRLKQETFQPTEKRVKHLKYLFKSWICCCCCYFSLCLNLHSMKLLNMVSVNQKKVQELLRQQQQINMYVTLYK